MGLSARSMHRAPDPVALLAESDGVFVGGGNTFRLLARIRSLGLLDPIRQRVSTGMRYAGASAGSNIACPTIKTTNDMPIVDPGGFGALSLFPHQINPNYVDRDPDAAHSGETRAQRISEFHEESTTSVVALYEGATLHHRDGMTSLSGGEALLFRRGRWSETIRAGEVIDF